MKLNAEPVLDGFFGMVAERKNIGGRGIARVHEKIAVLGGNLSAADLEAFEPALVDELAGRGLRGVLRERIFEKRAGAFAGGLFGRARAEGIVSSL